MMMTTDDYKYPRLFTENDLRENGHIDLAQNHVHYLRNVMRRKEGDYIRVFNGRDGEWRGEIIDLGKKSITLALQAQIRAQDTAPYAVHLVFAPLKKDRMDFLIEKAVELGVTDFHPILTDRTEVRKIKEDRLTQQITEACEQSERLTVPTLHPLCHRDALIADWNPDIPLIACIERGTHPLLGNLFKNGKPDAAAFIIGPVGGFTDEETTLFEKTPHIQTASLGGNVLRSETAAIAPLIYMMLS